MTNEMPADRPTAEQALRVLDDIFKNLFANNVHGEK